MKKNSPLRNRLVKKPLSFTIAPVTTSESPYQLQAGKSVVFSIQVTNQSAAADLVFLKCPELPAEWFTIAYLNTHNQDAPGIVQLTEKLSLDPQETSEIQLTLHPPLDAKIGNYFPTLQLISMSAPDLMTLDVIYLQLLPDTHLDTNLMPQSRTIVNQPVAFNFTVHNRGNVHRTLRLEAKDSENLFRFETDLANNIIKLAPGQESDIVLKTYPRNRWKRPFRGNPVRSYLGVTLVPVDELAGAGSRYSTQGKLIWMPQPKWVLALLTLMGAGTALLALGLLYRFNRPAIAASEILSFNATGQRNDVQLNWKLNNPEHLDKVVIAQLNEGAEIQTVRYDFSASIPQDLKVKAESGCRASTPKSDISALWQLPLPNLPWFSSLQQVPTPATIDCRNIPFTSKPANSLRYKLKLFSKSDAQIPVAEYTTKAIATQPGEAQVEQTFPTSQAVPIVISLTVNGISAQSQPTHTYSVREGEVAEIVVSWVIQGSTNVQLLPDSESVEPNSSATYRLRSGESKIVTLTAQNSVGERVSQSTLISAVGMTSGDRSPFRSSSPFQTRPAPEPSPKSSDPLPPEPESSPSSEIDQPSPTPESPSPEASPTDSPP